MNYVITCDVNRPRDERFALGDSRGPCAKALARYAFDVGADLVRHDYDLNLDDCAEHTLVRVRT